MLDNVFSSGVFVQEWQNHFNNGASGITFEFINEISFYKHPRLPLYTNIGRNMTKGMSYNIADGNEEGFRKKVFLIYDVPGFFDQQMPKGSKNLGAYSVPQYPGYLLKLQRYGNLAAYMAETFGRKSRNKLTRYKRRLEECFDIRYEMFYGAIDKSGYDAIFSDFRNLLEKRFIYKKETNNNLDPGEWKFYHEVTYPMILEKKAALFVVYAEGDPIGVMLNFIGGKTVYHAITVFDIDYSRFNVGSTGVMKLLEWCYENNFEILDFSKGDYEYKKRWTNQAYAFEYHILYDKRSLRACALAFYLRLYFGLKRLLRELQLNKVFHKITFLLSNRKGTEINAPDFEFLETTTNGGALALDPVDKEAKEWHRLKRAVFDFLYFNGEVLKNIKLYAVRGQHNQYLIKGSNQQKLVLIN